MFSTLRNRFGIPGVISVIALVFAMIGGAYAASNLGGSDKSATASAKKKSAKGPRGPRGATGPAGPAGTAGPAGPKGDSGANGSNGVDGAKGATGASGQSVKTETEPPFGNCGEQEGVKLTSASGVSYVCNGANGSVGPEGSPWAAGGTLPEGETETGAWSFGPTPAGIEEEPGIEEEYFTLSFSIPLAAPLAATETHVIQGGNELRLNESNFETIELVPQTDCLGTPAQPKAKSGHLCLYVTDLTSGALLFSNPNFLSSFKRAGEGGNGASISGARVTAVITDGSPSGHGTWAVTG